MTDLWIVKVLDAAVPRQSELLSQADFTIGHAFANDIVIRDLAAKGCRVAFDLSCGQPAKVRVLEGEVSVLGQTLAAPAAALLPAYVPLSIGGVQIAYGEPDHDRWEDAWRLARAVRSDRVETIAAEDMLPAESSRLVRQALSGAAYYSPVAFGLLALGFAAFAASGNLHSVAHASVPSAPMERVSPQAVVSRVEDLSLSLGVPATAVLDERGLMTLSAPRDADPSIVDEVRRRILRDYPGMKRVQVAFVDAAKDSRPSTSIDSAKRIVAAVDGPAGYLVAADGSKYFAGARMPTGQVLKSIDPNWIAFEENGVTTQLKLQNDGDK